MTENLFEGTLNNGVHITMRLLKTTQLPEILRLQEEVVEALEDKARLQPLSEEEFRFLLEGNGDMIGVYDGEEMVAWRAMLIPDNDHEGLGRDVGVPEDEISKVIYQEISAVSPRFRGNGLQKMMATVLMERVDRSRYRYVCATVMPGNIPSLKDKFSQGLEVAALKDKYGGKLRYVFFKDLAEAVPHRDEKCLVPMDDIAGQQALLADGWRGTELIVNEDGWQVRYKR
ncbi:GNAT family N-acetyltransferase [Bhargavaea ullalensis]|uniref:N-acetyltransferase domain-containing protein n=1 Tax=Bhargavaea ullalensis TaxID=1265685 RepID=A0ABV2G779_9BACL